MFSNLDSRLTSTPKRQTGNKKVNSENQQFEFNSGDEADNTMINNRLDDIVRNLKLDRERQDDAVMKLNLKLDNLSNLNDQLVKENYILKEKLNGCLKIQSKFSQFETKYMEINKDLNLLKSSNVHQPSLNNDLIIDFLQKGLNQLSLKLHKDIERVNDKLDSVSLVKPLRYNSDNSGNHINYIGNSVSNSGGFNYSEDDDSVNNKSGISLSNQNDHYILNTEVNSLQKSSNQNLPKTLTIEEDSKLQSKSQERIKPLIASASMQEKNPVQFTPPKPSFIAKSIDNQKLFDCNNDKISLYGSNSGADNSGVLISNTNSSEKPVSLFSNVANTSNFSGTVTKTDTSKNLFQKPVDNEKSIFSQNKNSDKPPNLFNTTSPMNMFIKSAEDQKSIFGQNKNADKPTNLFGNEVKPNNITNSLFGSPSVSKTSIFNSDNKSSNPEPKSLFGSGIFQTQEVSTKQSMFSNSEGPSFSSLASNCADFKFGTSETHTWKSGGKLFENSTTKTTEDNELVEEDSKDHEEECSAHFEPIVELPTIKSQTDVDLFDELFRNRCKLFRMVGTEWKERGLGDIKVVKEKQSDQKYRIIMRREKIAKLGCNHFILKDCPKFTPMANEKSVCWVAQDFSEGELKVETFAVKFSNESIMVDFKRVVQEIQDKLPSN